MSQSPDVGGLEEKRTRAPHSGEARRRSRRLVPGVIGISLVMILGALAVVPDSGFGVARAQNTSAGATPSTSFSSTSNSSTLATSNPLTTIYRDYSWAGYNGNSTIYPTTDTTPSFLPSLSETQFQTSTNNSYGVENSETVSVVSNLANETPRYWDLGSAGNYGFLVWIWFGAHGTSDQLAVANYGCNDPYTTWWTDAQNVAVSPTGLPSGVTNSFAVGNNTGRNVTTGNMGDNGASGSLLVTAEIIGLQALATFVSKNPELGIAFAEGDVNGFIGSSGPTNNNQHSSNPDVNGVTTANEWGVTYGGNWSNPCQGNTHGQNVFSQTVLAQEEFTNSGLLSSVTPGKLTLSALSEIEEDQYQPQTNSYQQFYLPGVNPSVSYSIEPAASVGGTAYLWNGGPAISGVQVIVQQNYNNGTFLNLEETSSASGYWHTFIKPGNGYYNQLWATFSDPLGATSNLTRELPTKDWAEGHDDPSVNEILDGGQVYGWVTGMAGSINEYIPGATVKMCNTQGCISTTTNSGGEYWLDFPVAGTSTDPYSMTISAPGGWKTTTYNGFQFLVGQYTQESLSFPPLGGGGCVAYGTPILTPGGYVPVQDLQKGQPVVEYDVANQSVAQGAFLYGNVTTVISLVDINDGLLYLTPTDQPIFIENNTFMGWLHDPQNLTTTDNLYEPVTQSWIHVSSVELIKHKAKAYDVVTSSFNDFIANGILLDKKT
jgi:hypothetical protein